jgi:hypothetical protein
MEIARHWFPQVVHGAGGSRSGEPRRLPIELFATLRLRRDPDEERVEASLDGELLAMSLPESAGPVRETIETRLATSARLALADPSTWIQVIDDRGAPLTYEIFLGQGAESDCRLHAGVTTPVVVEPAGRDGDPRGAMRPPGGAIRFVRGLYARLLFRTYLSPRGPRFHVESLLLPLVGAGHRVPMIGAAEARACREAS